MVTRKSTTKKNQIMPITVKMVGNTKPQIMPITVKMVGNTKPQIMPITVKIEQQKLPKAIYVNEIETNKRKKMIKESIKAIKLDKKYT